MKNYVDMCICKGICLSDTCYAVGFKNEKNNQQKKLQMHETF